MNKKTLRYVLIFTALLPIQYLSYNIYTNEIRDNSNYSNYFYDVSADLSLNGITSDYILYNNAVGASEPVYFIYSEIFAKLDLPYGFSILLLNLFFVFAIARAVCYFNPRLFLFFIILIYLFFDYYLFVLSSEVHRLKIGVAFFLLAITCKGKLKNCFSLLMVLSHLQMLLMLPLLYSFWGVIKKHIVSVSLIALLLFPYMLKKINYYIAAYSDFSSSFFYIVFNSILFLFFFPMITSGGKISNKYFIWLLLLFFFMIIVGHERINIFILEVGFFYFMYVVGLRSNRLGVVFMTLYAFSIIIYNFFKIHTQYNYLMSLV